MRICDRCGVGEPVPAVDEIRFKATDSRIDLCLSCSEDAREFLSDKFSGLNKVLDRATAPYEAIGDGR